MAHKKRALWKTLVGILSIAFIVYMWIKKDIVAIYSTMPQEQIVPLVVTTTLVSLAKVIAIAGAILAVKWILGKIKKKGK